jgi:hypothetical protein
MDIFCEILIKSHHFFEKRNPNLNDIFYFDNDVLFYLFFCDLNYLNMNYTRHKKLNIFLSNIFITDEKKNKILAKFCIAERHLNSFRKLLRVISIKRAKICSFETDLSMTPLNEIRENNKIKIYEKKMNMVYTFKFSDLHNIVDNCLSYAPNFFSQPLPIKNPLTNVEFSKSNLYNIYFRMRFEGFPISSLFHLFFLSEFDIKHFKIVNMCIIRDVAIKKHVEALSDEKKDEIIRELIEDYGSSNITLSIHRDFPSDILIKHFSHLIYDYYNENYSLNPLLRNLSANNISSFLTNFKKLNPSFGRKVIIQNKPFFMSDKEWNYDEEEQYYYKFVCDIVTKNECQKETKNNREKMLKRKNKIKKNKNKRRKTRMQ